MGDEMKLKLPSRFQIFHNVSEDYFFIRIRHYLFWYRDYETWQILCGGSLSEHKHLVKFATVKAAETAIQKYLQLETPDKIKLVKTL
jgi:hypothetical protein